MSTVGNTGMRLLAGAALVGAVVLVGGCSLGAPPAARGAHVAPSEPDSSGEVVASEPGEPGPSEPVASEAARASEPSMSAENEFDPATIQVGDTVAGMTVTDVDYRNDGYTIVARVKFRGRATVTGRFRHTGDVTEEAGFTAANHMVFMSDLDEASLAALPRMKGDPRAVSFVLTNFVDVAPEAFGPEGSTGTATVVVDEYRIDLEPIDAAFNTATLVEVVEVAVDQP